MRIFLALLAVVAAAAHDVVYQHRLAEVPGHTLTQPAYLWVPPSATTLRGVVLGGNVLCEGRILAHPEVRAAMERQSLAAVYFSAHPFSTLPEPATNAAFIDAVLGAFADASGHAELAQAPWMPIGHSVGTVFAARLLAHRPDRTFACLTFKGGFSLQLGRAAEELAGIPILHVQGQFEEFGPGKDGVLTDGETRETGWNTARENLRAIRREHAGVLLGLLVDTGSTHYALNDSVARHIAGFIEAAARQRIGAGGALRAVAAAEGAWTDGGLLTPAVPAAADAAFAGDKAAGFWHPTPELAAGAEAIHMAVKGKQPQYVSVTDPNGRPVPVAHDMRIKLPVKWDADGTFRVGAGFLGEIPRRYPPQPGPVGHAATPPSVLFMAGPIEALGDGRFRPVADMRLGDRAFVYAMHPGDATYRRAEQQALISEISLPRAPRADARPSNRQPKKAQVLSVELPKSVPASALPLKLAGTSDSGLGVTFHVDAGPARIVDGALVLDRIPLKARGRAQRLIVVAGQMGDGAHAPAAPIEFPIVIEP